MIPIATRPEPVTFDGRVRRPGMAWLRKHRIPLDRRLASSTLLKPYWRRSLGDLHERYEGVCALLCVYLERVTGAASVDHFIAKSRAAGLAYEWSNYRLACSTMNGRKRDLEGLLDPFEIRPRTFLLELVTGRIYPNPRCSKALRRAAQYTIDALRLDDAECREIRARHFEEFCLGECSAEYLRRLSPFVHSEAQRQKLL
ncbi:MAG: hypothetical protein HY901_38300 [Deltaproteobacteria bacterium]|nr:hypothetical protein [Deltaproteobacteria bacterium]